MRLLPAGAAAWCVWAAGCGGSNAPLSAPSYDPDGMTREALRQYDKNGSGTLEGAELDACPGLKGALPAADANGDKKLSADELTERFRAYDKAGVGAMTVACTVKLNGKPLEGATVTFTPEEFMGGRVKGAAGKSNAAGSVALEGEGGIPGLAVGVYRVTVSKAGPGGETIPARYNAATTLGYEVGPGGRGSPAAVLALTTP